MTTFSYLQIMNILATDYHVARMLGLGHVDQQSKAQAGGAHLYCVAYQTKAELGSGFPARMRTHIAITLPTRQTDHRAPPAPSLQPVGYGLDAINGAGNGAQITLPGGYAPDGKSRFVNIKPFAFPHQRAFEGFFATSDLFCLCAASLPIMYGLEYRGDMEANYRQPEILHDSVYFDHAGLPETLPIPDQNAPGKAIFTHRETEEGIHHYALYSINWFSRVSPLSNDVATDATVFVRKPLPPINLMAQFIQEEKQLIFSTVAEQTLLEGLAGPDKSLARVTFEWNQTHNDAYQFADQIAFYIRKQSALIVKGTVTAVQDRPANKALVSTGPFTISSVNPPQTVRPTVPAALAASFQGGVFASDRNLFEIESVAASGDNPSFVVKKILQRSAVEDPANPGAYIMSETYASPAINDLFTANQNLSQPAQWDAELDKKIKLEKFFPLTLSGSSDSANNQTYTVQEVAKSGANTEITVKEAIPAPGASTPGHIAYKKYIKYFNVMHGQRTILIDEDLTGEIASGGSVNLIAAGGNTGAYTVAAVFFANRFTRIVVAQALPDANARAGVLVLDKTAAISSFDGAAQKFVIAAQDLSKELIPAHREFHLVDEGESVHEFVIGGIADTAQISRIADVASGLDSGAFSVTLDNFVLAAPLDAGAQLSAWSAWHKGSIRIEEDPANFPPVGSAHYRKPEIKVLQVWSLDITGAQTRLIAFDATFNAAATGPIRNPQSDYMPIRTGANIQVNLHPGYRIYLTKANANIGGGNPFRSADLLPVTGEGSRKTLLSACSIDSASARRSAISAPVVLLALENLVPLPPGVPMGPSFATRPDVYGKSSYTFDIDVDTTGGRQPYAIVCYRADLRKMLRALYSAATVDAIFAAQAALPANDAAFFNNRFHDLANLDIDVAANQFRAYVAGGYRLPVPDNHEYVIPNPNTGVVQRPFDGIRGFGQDFSVTLYIDGNGTAVTETRPMRQVVKDAIEGAFLSLTEQPVLYRYVKDGRLTSSAKPRVRDANGDIIVPGNPIDFGVFDPFPMAAKYQSGAQAKLRFTDYTLDGAADTVYFYFAVEMNSKFEVSDTSPVAGPVSLVNAMPAEAPAIKQMTSTPADGIRGLGPRVSFRVNEFIDGENIKKIRIYRCTNHRDAVSVRNMTLAGEVAVGMPLIDDFAGVTDLPYGEPLFYRMVALREITNEQGLTEYVPSKPSEISLTNIIDVQNPPAPTVAFSSDAYAPGDAQIGNVGLSWEKTVHNGKYIVFKLNNAGNWGKIHELKSNAQSVSLQLAATTLGDGTLVKRDADRVIYHHFKVVAVNSSNLMSLDENVATI